MLPDRQVYLYRVVFLLVFLMSVSFKVVAQVPPCKGLAPGGLRLATGTAGGSYLRAGVALHDVAPELEIRPCSTGGSLENLALLSNGEVELAISQSDLLHLGWNGERLQTLDATNGELWDSTKFGNVQLVSWLFSEKLQILTASHAYVYTISDLAKKRIWRGPAGSGGYATAAEVLRAAGIDPDASAAQNGDPEIHDYAEAHDQLLKGKFAAIFRMTAVPIDYTQDFTADRPSSISEVFHRGGEVRMLSLEQSLVDRLTSASSYAETTIYRDSYPHLGSGVRTIGLGSTLVTRQGLTEQEAHKVELLFGIMRERTRRQALEREMNVELDLLDKKLDPGSVDDERILLSHAFPAVASSLQIDTWATYRRLVPVGIVAAILLLLGFWYGPFLNALGASSRYVVVAGLLVGACALFGVVLWIDEHKYSASFGSPFTAARSLFLYFANGLKTDSLMTSNGQFFALIALAVIATLVHKLNSEALDDSVAGWSKKLSNILHGRAGKLSGRKLRVVVNWNELAEKKVQEWFHDRPDAKVVVLGADACDVPEKWKAKMEKAKIEFIAGDAAQRAVLEEAGVAEAAYVLICSNWKNAFPGERRRNLRNELADDLTIRAIYAIRSLEQSGPWSYRVPILAEFFMTENEDEMLSAGAPKAELIRVNRPEHGPSPQANAAAA